MKEGTRRRLDSMPYDKDGVHATGYEVFYLGEWWDEYEDGSLKR